MAGGPSSLQLGQAVGRDGGFPFLAAANAEPVEQYRQTLTPQAEKYGVNLPAPRLDDDDQWPQKLDLLCQNPVPVVSFTFGLPPAQQISRLRRAGTAVWATVTTAVRGPSGPRGRRRCPGRSGPSGWRSQRNLGSFACD